MNSKKVLVTLVLALGLTCLAGPGFGATVIDFSGTGTYGAGVTSTNAQFGTGFSGGVLTGPISNELRITGADAQPWSTLLGTPVVSGNFIGHYVGNNGAQGAVALVLNQLAASFTFSLGYINNDLTPGTSISVLFGFGDSFVSKSLNLLIDNGEYQTFTVTAEELDLSSFDKILFTANNDAQGLEYGSMSYTAVPVPAAVWLLGSALAGLVLVRRRA